MTTIKIEPVVGTADPQAFGSAVIAGTIRRFMHCLAYNPTEAVVPIKIFLTSTSDTNDITCILDYDLDPRDTYLCPEVVGNVLIAGGHMFVQGEGISFSAVASNESA